MALVILLEKITEALDNSQFGICILIDFRKAFDTVEHNIFFFFYCFLLSTEYTFNDCTIDQDSISYIYKVNPLP